MVTPNPNRRLTIEELMQLVEQLLGQPCGCRSTPPHGCPDGWHTWYISPRRALGFVRKNEEKDGDLFLNIPKELAQDFEHDAASQSPALGVRVEDGRPQSVTRYQLAPQVCHGGFLGHWIPRTQKD